MSNWELNGIRMETAHNSFNWFKFEEIRGHKNGIWNDRDHHGEGLHIISYSVDIYTGMFSSTPHMG